MRKSIYSIGRDETCDIILFDSTNVISRVHAFLRIGKGGKYTISDQSMNGTYVNGIRITPGVEFPVTRKDEISFAHVADLDWSEIPDEGKRLRIIIASIVVAVIVLFLLGWLCLRNFTPGGGSVSPTPSGAQGPIMNDTPPETKKDTLKTFQPPTPKENSADRTVGSSSDNDRERSVKTSNNKEGSTVSAIGSEKKDTTKKKTVNAIL